MEEARQRAEATIDATKAQDKTNAAKMERMFKETMRKLNAEVSYILSPENLAKMGVTIEEYFDLVQRIDSLLLDRKDLTQLARKELEVYKTTLNLSRLEYVRAQIGTTISELYGDLEEFMEDTLNKEYLDTITQVSQSYIKNYVTSNAAINLAAVVNADFHGATWFKRLYAHNQSLSNKLYDILARAMLLGQNPQTVAHQFAREFNMSVTAAKRLLITEASRVNAQAQIDQLTTMGFDKYEYIAEMDARTCEVCGKLNGNIYSVKAMEPGINCHPMHTICRCTVVGVFTGAEDLLRRLGYI